eukprot:11632471-Alexandrium_andersonii.AAC.1
MAAPSTGVPSGTHTTPSGKKRRGVPLQNLLKPVPLQSEEVTLWLRDGTVWKGRMVQPYQTCPIQ